MFVNIHTHTRTGEGIEVLSLAATSGLRSAYPVPPFSLGVHPWQVDELSSSQSSQGAPSARITGDGEAFADALKEVETAPASAIGEIGLDFAPGRPDHGLQKMVFAAQLRIAEERGLPVILHCVRAFEPVMEILSGFTLRAAIFHGFVGSPEQARRAVAAGYYLSFGERSLGSPKTVEAMRKIPREKVFLETDESSLSISGIYAAVSKIIDISGAELENNLQKNYENVLV